MRLKQRNDDDDDDVDDDDDYDDDTALTAIAFCSKNSFDPLFDLNIQGTQAIIFKIVQNEVQKDTNVVYKNRGNNTGLNLASFNGKIFKKKINARKLSRERPNNIGLNFATP